jgi:hypothetical protein
MYAQWVKDVRGPTPPLSRPTPVQKLRARTQIDGTRQLLNSQRNELMRKKMENRLGRLEALETRLEAAEDDVNRIDDSTDPQTTGYKLELVEHTLQQIEKEAKALLVDVEQR